MAELRSQGGGSDACVLRFQNERDDAVLVFWIDYEGRAVGAEPCRPSRRRWRLATLAQPALVFASYCR